MTEPTFPDPLRRRVGDVAVEILPPSAYRSPLWHDVRRGTVSASEIAAVLGISPYQSRFDLWWSKRLGDSLSDNRAMSRGRRVEPLVLEDFADEHPHLTLETFGLVQNIERPWQVFTPDSLAYDRACGRRHNFDTERDELVGSPVAVVEAKTAGGNEGWGERGTDDVPDHYRAQVIWQMDTVGVDVAYIPVWVGFDYRLYVVAYDADDALFMREQARAFLDDLEAGTEPEIDAHERTTKRLKRLHPTVIEGEAEVPEAVVRQYRVAKRLRDTAQGRLDLAENRLRRALGDFGVGTVDGVKVCSRSVFEVRAREQFINAHTQNRLTVTTAKPKRNKRRIQSDR